MAHNSNGDQLVYFQPVPGQLPVLIGAVFAHDKTEQDIPDDCIPVRRGRTVAAVPLAMVRPVE